MMTIAKRKIQKCYFVLILLHFKLEVFCKLLVTSQVGHELAELNTLLPTCRPLPQFVKLESDVLLVDLAKSAVEKVSILLVYQFTIFLTRIRKKNRHMQWVRIVRRHRPNWSPSSQSILCSIHFDNSSYTMRRDVAASLGIKSILTSDAIPTIDAAIMVGS